jgi:peptide/nickel transport system permease protein
MRGYIIRRLLLLIPTLFFFSTIVFFAVRFLPGDIVSIMLSKYRTAGLDREQIARQLGVDVPIHVQYARWMGGILLRADFGRSLDNQRPVTEKIFPRSIPTLELGFVALLVSLLFGLPIGIYSALRQDTTGDYITRSISILFISTPEFFIAILVMIYPVLWFGWAPSVTMIRWSEDPLGHLVMILVPGTVLGLLISGMTMRMMRTMMLEVLRQDYIRTAWAKGLRERVVVVRHALKNALIPVITVVGTQIPWMVGGAVIIETVFALPGLGTLMIDSIFSRDYPAVSGINMIVGTFLVLVNFLVDIAYAWLDPRIRYR